MKALILNSLVTRLSLGPVEELLLLGGLIVDGENDLAWFPNFEAVADHWFIGWGNFPCFLDDYCVPPLDSGHKLSSIGHIPSDNAKFPN